MERHAIMYNLKCTFVLCSVLNEMVKLRVVVTLLSVSWQELPFRIMII